MNSDPEFEKRFGNKIKAILETQAYLQEAIAGLLQATHSHNEQGDQNKEQIKKLRKNIDQPIRQGQSQDEKLMRLLGMEKK